MKLPYLTAAFDLILVNKDNDTNVRDSICHYKCFFFGHLSDCVIFFRLTKWKVSVFGVFMTRIFPHSEWIRRDSHCKICLECRTQSISTMELFWENSQRLLELTQDEDFINPFRADVPIFFLLGDISRMCW